MLEEDHFLDLLRYMSDTWLLTRDSMYDSDLPKYSVIYSTFVMVYFMRLYSDHFREDDKFKCIRS